MEKVNDLRQLKAAALDRRSVWMPYSNYDNKPKPAAFVLCMTGQCILGMFKQGLYLYEPKPKSRGAAFPALLKSNLGGS